MSAAYAYGDWMFTIAGLDLYEIISEVEQARMEYEDNEDLARISGLLLEAQDLLSEAIEIMRKAAAA